MLMNYLVIPGLETLGVLPTGMHIYFYMSAVITTNCLDLQWSSIGFLPVSIHRSAMDNVSRTRYLTYLMTVYIV